VKVPALMNVRLNPTVERLGASAPKGQEKLAQGLPWVSTSSIVLVLVLVLDFGGHWLGERKAA
jgi:hypothetical protein